MTDSIEVIDMNVKEKFDAAVNVIKCLPKNGPYQPSHDMMLKFYGLYKQATEGPCSQSKPAFYEVVKGYKWTAWNSLGKMKQEVAMDTYVDELKKIVETMCYTDDVAEFIEKLGPFYEFVEIAKGNDEDNNHNVAADFIKNSKKDDLKVVQCNGTDFENDDKFSEKKVQPKSLAATNGLPEDGNYVNDDSQLIPISPTTSESYTFCETSPTDKIPVIKKILSDTDTEDEYSEPAEFIEVERGLSQNPTMQVVTCGGGDPHQADRVVDGTALRPKIGGGLGMRRSKEGVGGGDPRMQKASMGGGGGRRPKNSLEVPPCGGGGGRQGVQVDAQLVLILQKIHRDLQSVVIRLDSLETQAYDQHADSCSYCQRRVVGRSYGGERSWWPFPELSPRSTFFLLTWPLVLHGAVKLLLFLRSRRRRKTS